MVASKEELLRAKKFKDIQVSAWEDRTVRLLAYSAKDTMEFIKRSNEIVEKKKEDDNMIWSFIKAAVDEEFKPMFTMEEKDVVMELPFEGFMEVQREIMELNNLKVAPGEVKNVLSETKEEGLPIVSPSNSAE